MSRYSTYISYADEKELDVQEKIFYRFLKNKILIVLYVPFFMNNEIETIEFKLSNYY